MGQQIQVINGDGTFQQKNVEAFTNDQRLINAGVKYTTVAIMGPQSSGKSTLLNYLVRSTSRRPCGMLRTSYMYMHARHNTIELRNAAAEAVESITVQRTVQCRTAQAAHSPRDHALACPSVDVHGSERHMPARKA